jgi:hypothetical protein
LIKRGSAQGLDQNSTNSLKSARMNDYNNDDDGLWKSDTFSCIPFPMNILFWLLKHDREGFL